MERTASQLHHTQHQSEGRDQQDLENKLEQNDTSHDTHLRTVQTTSSFQTTLAQFKLYVPRSTCIDLAALKLSKHLRLKRSKSYAYYGEIFNNMRHGVGIMLYGQSAVYEGNWLIDRKHGRGYESYDNGSTYDGEFLDDKRHGLGTFLWINGEYYEGEWFQNKKQGTGTWKSPHGDSYVGEWKNNKSDGFGVHVWSNGDRYEGYFVECVKHGLGYQKMASGDLYKGNFEHGQKSGYGEYYWADGSHYSGQFKQGRKEGKGVWRSSNKLQYYEGTYKDGKREGYGVYVWSNGIVYKGQYHEDLKQGYGEMYWPSGEYYKGCWRNDQQHGEAETYAPRLGIKRCSFAHNAIIELVEEQQQPPARQPNPSKKIYQKVYNSKALKARLKTQPDSPARSNSNPRILGSSHKRERQTYHIKRNNLKQPRIFNTIGKESKLNLSVSRANQHTIELQSSKADSPINAYEFKYRKQVIPHSSFYIHRIDRRVKTEMHNQDEVSAKGYVRRLSESKFMRAGGQTKSYNLSKLVHKFRLPRYNIT